MKSPLGAQTVLGDRHDLIYEILLQVPSAACGTRPRELSNDWRRKQFRDESEKRSSENLIRSRGRHPMTTRHTRVDFRRSRGFGQNCIVESLKWATGVVFRHLLPISSRRACESHAAACGTRLAEFFNGWARKLERDGSEKRSSENLIRQRGQRNDLNPGEFASRASLRSSAQHV